MTNGCIGRGELDTSFVRNCTLSSFTADAREVFRETKLPVYDGVIVRSGPVSQGRKEGRGRDQ